MQEDKELQLIDLCARLPHGVKVRISGEIDGYLHENTTTLDIDNLHKYMLNGGYYKYGLFYKIPSFQLLPYLRPLSSMTEKEKKELQKITNNTFYASSNYISNSNTPLDGEWHASYNSFVTNAVCNKLISWLDKNHFDHRTDKEGKTLIEKGLAIEVTKENNPYE